MQGPCRVRGVHHVPFEQLVGFGETQRRGPVHQHAASVSLRDPDYGDEARLGDRCLDLGPGRYSPRRYRHAF
jgi:hypothetical protein